MKTQTCSLEEEKGYPFTFWSNELNYEKVNNSDYDIIHSVGNFFFKETLSKTIFVFITFLKNILCQITLIGEGLGGCLYLVKREVLSLKPLNKWVHELVGVLLLIIIIYNFI